MGHTASGNPPGRALFLILLLAILALAFVLRCWGVFHDLPYILHPDEPFNINVVQRMYVHGTMNPHFFHYPSVFYSVNWFVAEAYFGLRELLTGAHWQPPPMVILALGTTKALDVEGVILFRCVTLAVGMFALLMCYWVGAKAYDRRVGLLAMLLLAVSPIVAADCRHLTPDTYLLLSVLLAIWAALDVAQSGSWRSYLVAGAAVGLAAATKYNGAIVALCLVAAHYSRVGLSLLQWQRLCAGAVCSVLAFVLCTPFVLIDYAEFSRAGALFQFEHYSGGHAGMEGGSVEFYLRALWISSGIAGILALLRLLPVRRERNPAELVLAAGAIPYFVFICLFNVRNERTLQPVLPCIALLAAAFVFELRNRLLLRPVVSTGLRRLLLLALGLALTFAPLRLALQQAVASTTPDSRSIAREWIEQNLPADSVVSVENYSPFVDPTRFRVVRLERSIDHETDWYMGQGVQYVVMSQGMFGRYFDNPQTYPAEVGAYFRLMRAFTQVKRFDAGNFLVYIYRTSDP